MEFQTTVPKPPRKAFLLGVGGAGMSGLARLLKAEGYVVRGSDRFGSAILDGLAEAGIETFRGHEPGLLWPDADLVVASAAIPSDNPILSLAREKGVRILKYAEALGLLFGAKRGIAVSGTHGKTTTSALTAFLLLEGGVDPSYLIGGMVKELSGNARSGAGPHFVAEACEYDRSFHALSPSVAVVTNIEADHLDSYGTLEGVVEGFEGFLRNLKPGGRVVVGEDVRTRDLVRRLGLPVVTTGLDGSNDFHAREIKGDGRGFAFDLWARGADLGPFELSLAGRHNLQNALAALAIALDEGVEVEKVRESLPRFRGVQRRFEILGQPGGVTVVSDYGHHPTEIRVTVAAARSYFPGQRIVLVFQPHQHCRTRWLFREFAESLALADEAIVPSIYSVRESEEERRAVGPSDLVRAVLELGGQARHLPEGPELWGALEAELRKGDVLLVMGAGDIGDFAVAAAQRLSEARPMSASTAARMVVGRNPQDRWAWLGKLGGIFTCEESCFNPI